MYDNFFKKLELEAIIFVSVSIMQT